jgi:hypothetical protein
MELQGCYFPSYKHTGLHTRFHVLPICDVKLGLLTVAMPEARLFVESLKPYINILLIRKLFLLVASFHYTPVYYCNFPSHISWQIYLVLTTVKVSLFFLSFSFGAVLSNFHVLVWQNEINF